MPPDTLAGVQGAPEVQIVEGGCPGAPERMEAMALSALHGGTGYSVCLALPSGQRGLPAPAWYCTTATGCGQRLPSQTEVTTLQLANCLCLRWWWYGSTSAIVF